MNDHEYTQWIITDTWAQVKPALIMYVAVLSLYWILVA
jgi:hypothetical protein